MFAVGHITEWRAIKSLRVPMIFCIDILQMETHALAQIRFLQSWIVEYHANSR